MIEATCSKCNNPLEGYLIKGDVLVAEDIVAHFSDRITKETVNTWFATGVLTGWKTKGIRGWWTTVAQFELDLKHMRRRPRVGRDAGAAGSGSLPT